MSLRRAVGFLHTLKMRFSPPRTAPARSIHSLRDLPLADGLRGAAGAAAAALAGGGALAFHQYKKGKKEEDMKEMFEDWVKGYNKTYRDEEEKAMRFQMFKDTVDKSPRPPEKIHYFSDRTDEEIRRFKAYPDGIQHEEYAKFCRDLLAKVSSFAIRLSFFCNSIF